MASAPPQNKTPDAASAESSASKRSAASALLGSGAKPPKKLNFTNVDFGTAGPAAAKTGGTNNIWVEIIRPAKSLKIEDDPGALPIYGILITPMGDISNTHHANPLFIPGENPVKEVFLGTAKTHSCSCDAIGADGKQRKCKSRKNGSEWPFKSFLVTTTDPKALDLEVLQTCIAECLLPSIEHCRVTVKNCKWKMTLTAKKRIKLVDLDDTETIRHVKCWSDVLPTNEEVTRARMFGARECFHDDDKKHQITFKEWCQLNKKHICTCWQKGKIPSSVIEEHKLDKRCMEEKDWLAHLKTNPNARDMEEEEDAEEQKSNK